MIYKFTLTYIIIVFFICRLSAQQIRGDSIPCYGTQQVYSLSISSDFVSWFVTGNNLTQNLIGNQFLVQWTSSGTSIVTCIYSDSYYFMDTVMDTIRVQSLPSPLITALNSQSNCQYIPIQPYTEGPTAIGPMPVASISGICYSVCDSGWYAYVAKGWAGSTFSWNTPGANGLVYSSGGDTVRIDWMAALPLQNTLLENTSLTLIETSMAGCRDSSTICIGVNAKPHACFTSAPQDSAGIIRVCANSTISFSDSCTWVPQWINHPGNVIDRTWIFGDGSVVINQSTVTHQYNSPGNYLVQYIAQSNCYCADTFSVTVHVDSLAGPEIQCISTVCHNTWAAYYVRDTCSHTFYWTVTGADSIRASNDSIYVLWDSCNNGYGTISVTTDCPSYCPYQTTVRVPVLPASATVYGDTIVCRNDNVTYSVPYVPGTSYEWFGPDTSLAHLTAVGYPSDMSTYVFAQFAHNYNPVPFTVYVGVIYSNLFLNCSGISILPVRVTTGIGVGFLKGDSVICYRDSLELYAINGHTSLPVSCNWAVYLSSNDSLVDTLSNNPNYFSNTLTPGTYVIYTRADTSIFCDVPFTNIVTVLNPPPSVTAPVIGADSACPNVLITYYSEPTDASKYYLQWNTVNGIPGIGSGNQFLVAWLAPLPDTLDLSQLMLQSPGCPSVPVKVPIYPISNIHPTITGDTTVCSDGIVSYKTSFAADNYQWSISPSTSGSVRYGEGGDSISVQWNHFTADTVAYLLLIGTKCSYPDSAILKIHINKAPVPTISVSPLPPICTGKNITFTSSLTGLNYVWNFGDGSADTSAGVDTVHQFSVDSSFTVTLTIDSPAGCPGTSVATTSVSVLPSPVAFLSTPQSINRCGQTGWADTLYVTLQNMGGIGFTYQFYNSSTLLSGPGTSNQYIATQPGTYSAIVTTDSGCSAPTNNVIIDTACGSSCSTTYPITFSDAVYCDSVIFSTAATSPVTLTGWDFGDGTNTTSSATSIYHLYAQAGYYHATLNATAPSSGDGGGTCSIPYSGVDTVPLVANFLVQFKCQGSTGMHVELIDISTYINPITSWNWRVDDTLRSTTQDVDTTLRAGTHTIKLIIFDGAHTCSQSKTITMPTAAVANFTDTDNLCITLPINLAATDTTNIISYLWDFGDSSYSALLNTSKVYATCFNNHGGSDCSQEITLSVTDKYGCQSSVTKPVYYFEDQFTGVTLSLTPSLLEVCANASEVIQIVTSPSTTFYHTGYKWNNDVVTAIPQLTVTQTGTYSVIDTDVYRCIAKSATSSSVIFNTIQGFISGDTLYCNNTLTNLNIFQGFQYQYYWLYDTGSIGPATHNTLPASSQSYSFIHFMNNDTFPHCRVWGVIRDSIAPGQYCEDTLGPVWVRVFPHIPNPTGGKSECVEYQPAVFVEVPPTGGIVLWNTGLVSDTLSTSIPGIYTAEFIDTNGCVSDSNAVFTALSGPGFSDIPAGCYAYCLGDTPKLFLPVGDYSYFVTWLRNDTALSGENIYALQAGDYQLVLNNYNIGGSGCQDTSLPISISFMMCDSSCFKHANVYCSNCYYDSVSGKRYVHLLISISDTIASNIPIGILSSDLTILSFYPSTLVVGTGTSYLNIDALADSSSGGQYCVEVEAGSCKQEFCVNTSSLSCTRITASMHRGGAEAAIRKKSKYRVINNK